MAWQFNKLKRQRHEEATLLHVKRDDLDETFCGLATQLELIKDLMTLNDRIKDSTLDRQIDLAVKDVRQSIAELAKTGVSLMDLYRRFGATIFKAKLTMAQETMAKSQAQGYHDTTIDLVSTDRYLAARDGYADDPIEREINLDADRVEDLLRTDAPIPKHNTRSEARAIQSINEQLKGSFRAIGQRLFEARLAAEGDDGPRHDWVDQKEAAIVDAASYVSEIDVDRLEEAEQQSKHGIEPQQYKYSEALQSMEAIKTVYLNADHLEITSLAVQFGLLKTGRGGIVKPTATITNRQYSDFIDAVGLLYSDTEHYDRYLNDALRLATSIMNVMSGIRNTSVALRETLTRRIASVRLDQKTKRQYDVSERSISFEQRLMALQEHHTVETSTDTMRESIDAFIAAQKPAK